MPQCPDLLKPEQLLPHQPYGAIIYWLPWLQIRTPSAVWLHHRGWKKVSSWKSMIAFKAGRGLSINHPKNSLKNQVTKVSYPIFNVHYSTSSAKGYQGAHMHIHTIREKSCPSKSRLNSGLPSSINNNNILH